MKNIIVFICFTSVAGASFQSPDTIVEKDDQGLKVEFINSCVDLKRSMYNKKVSFKKDLSIMTECTKNYLSITDKVTGGKK